MATGMLQIIKSLYSSWKQITFSAVLEPLSLNVIDLVAVVTPVNKALLPGYFFCLHCHNGTQSIDEQFPANLCFNGDLPSVPNGKFSGQQPPSESRRSAILEQQLDSPYIWHLLHRLVGPAAARHAEPVSMAG